jgi:hypothetical protein
MPKMSGSTRHHLYRINGSASSLLNLTFAQTIKTSTTLEVFGAVQHLYNASTLGWAEGACIVLHAPGADVGLREGKWKKCFLSVPQWAITSHVHKAQC